MYIIGIDLGTTNSVVAYAAVDAEEPQIHLLAIPQVTAAGTVEARTSLPSFLYQGTPDESAAFKLPWQEGRATVVGEHARRQSAEAPQRTVAGAKSWLAHHGVDRREPILPWNAPDDVEQVSPVAAAAEYLSHLAAAWNAAFPDAPLVEQQVVLTVPASFDAAARELTREAAATAGLPEEFVLLEEPQAAVYAWLDQMGDRWRKALGVGDTLLVCDVGGGTTDLTLVGVQEEDGELQLERRAVGRHLLVGGDNMDLALAHHAAGMFAEQGVQLDPWQSVALWHSCRAAKEKLLAPDGPATHTISVLGRGSKLIGGTVSIEVEREAMSRLLIDGFFPLTKLDDRPLRRRASGFQEIGLPFEQDTAITRHIAEFLSTHGDDGQPARPTQVLFNGGVFTARPLAERLLEAVGGWFDQQQPPAALEGAVDLDNAVARGAAFYGWAKQHGGVRIRGGAARSYYLGLETAGLAVPGAPRPLRAVCVVPIGMEEGTAADVPGGEIGLVVGEPAQFRFFSSSTRKDDRPGDVLDRWGKTNSKRPTRWKRCSTRSKALRSRTSRSRWNPGLRNSACLNCGACSRPKSGAGSWSSVSARNRGWGIVKQQFFGAVLTLARACKHSPPPG